MDMKKRSTSKGWKILTLLFALLLVMPVQVLAAPEEPSGWQEFSDISVASYYVMDADTGEEILSHNADKKRSNASTTKIMTALILVEDKNFDPDLLLTVSAESLFFLDPNSARIAALKEGDQLSTLDCLAALLIASANDVARVIAQNYGGAYGAVDPQRRNDAAASQELFVARMNERARELGALSTNFTNPAGFDEADGSHYTTAHDIAVIAAEAMKNPLIAHVVSLEYYRMPVTPAHDKAWWATMGNSNALVIYGADYLESQYYEKYTGVKTGTTPQAGRCLVGSGLTTDGRTFVCAALGINPVSINNMPFLARAVPVRAIMEEAARLEGVPKREIPGLLDLPETQPEPVETAEPGNTEPEIPASAGKTEGTTAKPDDHALVGVASTTKPVILIFATLGVLASIAGIVIAVIALLLYIRKRKPVKRGGDNR